MDRVRYELKGGSWTMVILLNSENGKGKVPFPIANAKLVKRNGTALSKEHLKSRIGEDEYGKL